MDLALVTDKVSLGTQIKNVRLVLGKSRRDFGNAIGVSVRTVESWEQGLRRPATSSLYLITNLWEEHSAKYNRTY